MSLSSQLLKASLSLTLSPSSISFSSKRRFSSSVFAPRPLFSSRVSRSSLSTTTAMGSAAAQDAAMDAVQRRLMFDDECILVDESDNVVGHDSKYNCHLMDNIKSNKALHRAFSIFLFNNKFELLLQQRSSTKVTFPLVWTNTCCSHPLYRESELIEEDALGVRNAAQRKLFDELGILAEDVPVDQFTSIGRILYKAPSDGKWGEHEHTGISVLSMSLDAWSRDGCGYSGYSGAKLQFLNFQNSKNGTEIVEVNPNPDEVADVKYVNQEQLKELVRKADAGEDGLKLSPWFRLLVVNNFLFKWWDHLQQGTLHEVVDMKTIHKLT